MTISIEQYVEHGGRRGLVGRESELALGGELLREGTPTVTIWGTAGVGKTTLADTLTEADPRTVVRIDVAPCRNLADLAESLVVALGVAGGAEANIESTLENIAFALTQRTGELLYLDNVEHLVTEVSELIASWDERPQVLLTSRQPTNLTGEVCLALGVLDDRSAVALFHRRAAAIRHDYEPDDEVVLQLVEQLDRLPLAIELAAGRASIMSPADILARMTQRFALLSSPGQRQRLEESIDFSWQLLDDADRDALAVLSVLNGPFDRELAVALGVAESVGRLMQASLVEARDDHFALLVTIRDFGRTRIDGAARMQACNHLRDFYLREAPAHDKRCSHPGDYHAFDWLRFHKQHILDTARHFATSEPDAAATMLLSVSAISIESGVIQAFEELLAAVEPQDVELERRRLVQLCLIATSFGSNERSKELLAEAEKLDPDRKDLSLYQRRYWAFREEFQLEAAEQELLDALEVCAEVDDELREAEFELMLCSLRTNLAVYGIRDADTIPANHARLLALQARRADKMSTAHELSVLDAIAYSYKALNQPEKARDTYRSALPLLTPLSGWEVSFRIGWSKVERELGNHEAALQIALEAVESAARSGRRGFLYHCYTEAADRAWHLREYEQAVEYSTKAIRGGELHHQPMTVRNGLISRLTALGDLGDWDAVRADVDRLRENEMGRMGDYLTRTAEALLAEVDGHFDEAREVLEETLEVLLSTPTFREGGDAWKDLWRARLNLMEVPSLLEKADARTAQTYVAEARTLLEALELDAPRSLALNGAWNSLFTLLAHVDSHLEIPEDVVEHQLVVGEDGTWFELDGNRVDLSTRKTLSAILLAIASDSNLSTDQIVEAGWPGERIEANAARNRVYAAIRGLRKMGLEDVLVSKSGKYSFAPSVFVRVS